MRYTWLVSTFLVFAASAAFGDGPASDVSSWREVLMAGNRPAKIEEASHISGCIATDCNIDDPNDLPNCIPTDCSTDIDGLSIMRDKELLLREGGESYCSTTGQETRETSQRWIGRLTGVSKCSVQAADGAPVLSSATLA